MLWFDPSVRAIHFITVTWWYCMVGTANQHQSVVRKELNGESTAWQTLVGIHSPSLRILPAVYIYIYTYN